MWYYNRNNRFNSQQPLLEQMAKLELELDQKLYRALEVSASKPNLDREDTGFPDSYITLALYHLNSILTRIIDLDESRLNIFHNYKLAPPSQPAEVIPGKRLCVVLNKAVDLAVGKKTIGVGDFLRAVVSISLDFEPMRADGFENQVLHHTFSIETLLWGLGYTAWTPLSDAPEIHHILQSLDGREPIEDFQYMMALENDRIVFRPTSVLNEFQLQLSSSAVKSELAVLTHFQDQYASVRPSQILELEDLINNKRVKEADIQRFFELNPQFFRMWDYRDIYPHVFLTKEDEGSLIPDFILVDPEMQKAMILDLKLPKVKLVRRKPNRIYFASAVQEAKAQLLEYRDWFEDRYNRAKLKEQFGMEVFRPRIGVIIGSDYDFNDAIEKQRLIAEHPDIQITTYDDIVKHAQRRLLVIKGAMRGS